MTNDQVVAYRLRGWTLARIAAKAQLTPARISQICFEAGAPVAKAAGPARGTIRSPKVKAVVRWLKAHRGARRHGDLKAAAEHLGVSPKLVYATLKKFQLGLYA